MLKPGGIAGFAEPGPRHSRTPVSQFEMRNYRVVENDVDVHAIWRSAKGVGFRDLQVAVFHAPPFRVPLDEFEDFLAGGQATAPWVTSTRVFLRNARTFFLTKAGERAARQPPRRGPRLPHPSARRPRRPCRPARPSRSMRS